MICVVPASDEEVPVYISYTESSPKVKVDAKLITMACYDAESGEWTAMETPINERVIHAPKGSVIKVSALNKAYYVVIDGSGKMVQLHFVKKRLLRKPVTATVEVANAKDVTGELCTLLRKLSNELKTKCGIKIDKAPCYSVALAALGIAVCNKELLDLEDLYKKALKAAKRLSPDQELEIEPAHLV